MSPALLSLLGASRCSCFLLTTPCARPKPHLGPHLRIPALLSCASAKSYRSLFTTINPQFPLSPPSSGPHHHRHHTTHRPLRAHPTQQAPFLCSGSTRALCPQLTRLLPVPTHGHHPAPTGLSRGQSMTAQILALHEASPRMPWPGLGVPEAPRECTSRSAWHLWQGDPGKMRYTQPCPEHPHCAWHLRGGPGSGSE